MKLLVLVPTRSKCRQAGELFLARALQSAGSVMASLETDTVARQTSGRERARLVEASGGMPPWWR